MIHLFIGGVRSGKSDAAENLVNTLVAQNPLLKPAYIATSLSMGEESIERIKRHQAIRKKRFQQTVTTYELDYQQQDLLSVLNMLNDPENIVLIECLSTWVGWYLTVSDALQENLISFDAQQDALLAFLKQTQCHVVIVTGEVGCGLIGETTLQRRYADKLGELNQKVAALSDHVFLLTAGIKQALK
jgi:adenosylcobinamide kinase / adenosylcobinamide-phosphate guanylyltransferase